MFEAYYYLVSSLPLPRWEEPPPFTADAFIELCSGHLTPVRNVQLQAVRLEPIQRFITPTYTEWAQWETYLRNALARRRAARLGIDAERWTQPEEDAWPYLERRIEEIFNASDPWARQMQLDLLRWQRLDELQSGHYFDFEALVVYKLRILLLEKRTHYTVEAGEEAFSNVIERIRREAAEHRHVEST